MPLRYRLVMRALALLLMSCLCQVSQGQWKKAEMLTGGSVVTDIISFNGDIYAATSSAGIFKSSDKGDTWARAAVLQTSRTHFASHGSTLLAISYGKTFSTIDGNLWTEGAGPEAFVNDVGFDGPDIFAATSNGIYKSVDGGVTWTRNPDVETHHDIKSIAVKGNTVWAGLGLPAAGSLLKSDDSGSTWAKTSLGTNFINDIVTIGNDVFINISFDGIYASSNQGIDWQRVRNTEISGGKLHASPTTLYYLSGYKLYSSTDAGRTWSEKSQSIPAFGWQTLYSTNEHVFVGLWGGGVVRTAIEGSADWQLANNGIAVHQINDLTIVGSTIYAGLEYSFIRVSKDAGQTWQQLKSTYGLFSEDGQALLSQGSELFVGSGGGGVQRSSDNGATWLLKNEGLVSQNILDFASANNALFVGTDDGVYKSIDNGDNWIKKTGEIATLRTLYSDGTSIYAGTFSGLFQSKDAGETWIRISTGLPDESIGSIVHMGMVLFAATQYNGVYKTSDFGSTWENISGEYVAELAVRNNHLFLSTLDGELLISADSGKTAKDIAASLPIGTVSAIDFTDENIVIGKGNAGLWTRQLSEILPPFLTLSSSRKDNKFYVSSPLYINSDQALFSSPGMAMSEGDLASFITVTTGEGTDVPYSAQIDAETKSITLHITGVGEGEVYTVTVHPIENESGLASPTISKAFTAVVNHGPVVLDVIAQGEQGSTVSFNQGMFSDAFIDEDGDRMINLRIEDLPSHGVLKLNDTPLIANQVVATTDLGQLTYTPQSTFSGSDEWHWNGSDGIEFSTTAARVIVHIAPITEVVAEAHSFFKLYPNPVSSTLRLEMATPQEYHLDIRDITGRQVILRTILNPDISSPCEVNLSSLPEGVYVVRIQSGTGQQFQQKIIKR